MKKLLLLSLLLFAFIGSAQQQLFVEVRDTTITAYNVYYSGLLTQEGEKEVKRDSVGTDQIRITRMYYLFGEVLAREKRYIPGAFAQYLSEPKGSDTRN